MSEVRAGSPAAGTDIEAGDCVLAVNGRAPADVLEYMELADAAHCSLVIKRGTEKRQVSVNKQVGEPLGLVFENAVFNGTMTCRNRCRFCFVEQLPRGMRPGLYVRDDDYRLSFLFGNFITLTNLRSSDVRRILEKRLSPLYVSLQAAQPSLRREIFGNRRAASSLRLLREMLRAGLEIHLQVVVCPGLNDGPALRRTLELVGERYSAAASVGLVPVGFTRLGPPALRRVGKPEAERVIALVTEFQKHWLQILDRRLVFASDEFYLLAGVDFPAEEEYEGYPQLQNGIGLARKFINEVKTAGAETLGKDHDALAVTGTAGAAVLEQALREIGMQREQARASLLPVSNRLFGPEVTVTGLVPGQDIISAYGESERHASRLLIPASMLRENQFIDSMTLDHLQQALDVEVEAVEVEGSAFLSALARREVAA